MATTAILLHCYTTNTATTATTAIVSATTAATAGYFTNSICDQLPVGLIAQLVEHCTSYRRGHGFESRSGLNFFQALISQLLKLCAYI